MGIIPRYFVWETVHFPLHHPQTCHMYHISHYVVVTASFTNAHNLEISYQLLLKCCFGKNVFLCKFIFGMIQKFKHKYKFFRGHESMKCIHASCLEVPCLQGFGFMKSVASHDPWLPPKTNRDLPLNMGKSICHIWEVSVIATLRYRVYNPSITKTHTYTHTLARMIA